jgi:hypothetical protein
MNPHGMKLLSVDWQEEFIEWNVLLNFQSCAMCGKEPSASPLFDVHIIVIKYRMSVSRISEQL